MNQSMRLTSEQIRRLAERLVRQLKERKLIVLKSAETEIVEAVEQLLQEHRNTSQKLEERVKKLMQQYSTQIDAGNVDRQRMYMMIRRQVAQEMQFELDPEEQVTLLSHRIQDRLYHDDLVDYPDDEKAIRAIKQLLHESLLAETALDDKVREKIRSLKRGVVEGTTEWNILYRKYMEEELAKRNR